MNRDEVSRKLVELAHDVVVRAGYRVISMTGLSGLQARRWSAPQGRSKKPVLENFSMYFLPEQEKLMVVLMIWTTGKIIDKQTLNITTADPYSKFITIVADMVNPTL